MQLSPEKKIAGVLAPLFGLRSDNDLGIGDVAVLREFIDWGAEIGFKLIQLLPINEMGADNSPYNAISAMAIEPTTLHLAPGSPEDLTREDYDAAMADVDLAKLRQGHVKYSAVKKLKRCLLEKAFANFRARASQDRLREFGQFCNEESGWLDQYEVFRVLVEWNGESAAWDRWPEEHRSLGSAIEWRHSLGEEERRRFEDRAQFFAYVQWVAHQQWDEVKKYAEGRGVALMGDVPFGVSYYSADVFAKRGEFVLDWCGGAPPETHFKDDTFTQKWGQNWGIPIYDWADMGLRNFDWWRQRVRAVAHCFHLFRIDHVLGFYRIYAFPWRPRQNKKFLDLDWNQMLGKTGGRAPHFHPRDDFSPQNCEANRQEGEEYLRAVLEEAGSNLHVIGEDLGTVPDYVRPSLRSLGIAGFKIPQWEFYHGRIVPGSEYERLSVATYCTHDHPPVRAMWEEAFGAGVAAEQARSDLEKIAAFSGFRRTNEQIDYERDFYPAILHALFESESWIAIVMITDLLARKYRFNVPGTAGSSNWTRRMQRSVSQLRSSPKERKRMQLIRALLEKTGRI